MKQQRLHSLAFKIGIVIIMIEVIVLSLLGWYYTYRFRKQIDQRVMTNIQIPGKLMSQNLLPYNIVTNAEVMKQLVGEEMVDSMLIWVNGYIIHALQQDVIGKMFSQVPALQPEWFAKDMREPITQFISEDHNRYAISITPIPGVDGRMPVFFVYIKTRVQEAEQEKIQILLLFVGGVCLSVWITFLALLVLFRQMIFLRLTQALQILKKVSSGQLAARIPPPFAQDEIGQLQQGINTMIAELETQITTLHQEMFDRRQIEEALRQSEHVIHSLFESLPQHVYSKDREGRFIFANQSFCRLYDLSLSELIGKTDFDLHSKDLAQKYRQDDHHVLESGQMLKGVEYHEIIGDEGFYVQVVKTPLLNSRGEITGTLGIFWDITTEKKAVETLRQSELLYRTTINALHEAIYVVDQDLRLTLCNSAFLQWASQFSSDTALIGQSIAQIFPFLSQHVYDEYVQVMQAGKMCVTEHLMMNNGQERILETYKIPVIEEQQVLQIITVMRDITENKRTDKTIRETNERYQNLIENAPLGIASFDTEGRILHVNTMFVAIFGAPSVDSICQMNILTSSALLDAGIAQDASQCLETGIPVSEERLFTSDWNKQVYVRYYFTPITDSQGSIKEVHALIEDCTERKLVERALRESETEYRSLFKNMLSGVAYHKIVVNEENQPIDYIFLEINDAYERLTGMGKQVIGKRITELIPGITQYKPDLISIYGHVALTGEETSLEFFFEPFGVWYSVAVYSSEIGYFVTIYDDITERKWAEESLHKLNEELEQRVQARTNELQKANKALQESLLRLEQTQNQLVQSEKMAALGGLVAGIAHEINTPVGIGVTAASFLRQKTEDIRQLYDQQGMKRSDFENYLDKANDSTLMILVNLQRAADLIQSFKQVAVDQTSWDKRTFKLREYIDKVLLSLVPKLKRTQHSITVNCSYDIELTSYPGDFSQIITNLIINSLIHGFDQIAQGKIDITASTQNDWLIIEYHDNGKGITQEHLPKIFEPFYTTKRGQGGSGLGLNIVYNLVTQRLKGRITCHSIEGSGTTFIIEIPVTPYPMLSQLQ